MKEGAMAVAAAGTGAASELELLRARLAESEEALRAIRGGDVDAVVVSGGNGERIYTLGGADRVYRRLFETMSEGAMALSSGGMILTCNARVAEMLGLPLDRILGTSLADHLPPSERKDLPEILAQARTETSRREIRLKADAGVLVPVHLSTSRLESEGTEMVFCLVLTDLTEQKSHEKVVAAERLARLILEQAAGPIVVCDAEGRVIRVSQAALRLCDGGPLQRDFAVVFPLRTPDGGPFLLAPVLGGGTLRDVDVTLARDGGGLDLILNAGPLLGGAEILGCVVTMIDITERKRAEDALRQGEILARSLVDHLPQRIFVKDRDSSFLFVNASLARDMGVEPREVVGRDDLAFFSPELAEGYRADDREVMDSGRMKDRIEGYRAGDLDGWIHTVKVPYRNSSGEVIGVVGLFEDVTERRRAEQELREKENLLSEAQRLGHIGSWLLDRTGTLSWSEEMYRVYGVAPESFPVTVESMVGLMHPEDRPAMREWITACAAGRCPGELEYRILLPDGSIRFLSGRGEAVVDPGTGASHMAGTAQDITARKRGEQSLKLQGAALNAAANGMLITDRKGTIEWVNPAFTAYTGYAAEESIGRNVRMLRSDRQDPAFYEALWRTILAGDVWHGELVNRRKDGSLYSEEMTITPLRDAGGGIAHFIAVKQDITQRISLEGQVRQAQKMEAVGRLAGGVAHDFNNMLSVILGYGELVLGNLREGDPLRTQVAEIVKAGKRSAALTRQLLAFSRKQVLQPEVVDLNPLLKDLQKMLDRLIGEDIALSLSLDPGIGRVFVDRGQMEQVMMNLVVNSRDAMPGGGRLSIATRNADLDDQYAREHPGAAAGRYVDVSVADTGCGMDAETLSRIFEPFFTTKESGKGTGLGLATVYGIVKQSSGYVAVRSEPGRGTTFDVFLPRTDAAPAAKAQPAAGAVRPGGDRLILVVEDEPSVRGLLEGVLASAGYRVALAANAGEALLVVEEQGLVPALLITDLVMPGMGGEILVTRLRKGRPGLKVLLMSGYTETAIGQQGGVDPDTPFIRKPFTVEEILLKVEQVLDEPGA